jgi:hypothetical protein
MGLIDCLGGEPPDLGPLRALAGREELADAASLLTNSLGWPLPADDPLAPLARGLTGKPSTTVPMRP